jgi:hypothetical protein
MFYINKKKVTQEDVFNPFIRKCNICNELKECVKTDLGDLCVLCLKGLKNKKV